MTAYCYRFAVGVESDTTRWRYWVDESVKKQPTMDICKCWTGYFLQEQERYKAAADWFESAAGHQFHDSKVTSAADETHFFLKVSCAEQLSRRCSHRQLNCSVCKSDAGSAHKQKRKIHVPECENTCSEYDENRTPYHCVFAAPLVADRTQDHG